MIRVIIVDDESIIQQGVKTLIDWNELNCTISKTCKTVSYTHLDVYKRQLYTEQRHKQWAGGVSYGRKRIYPESKQTGGQNAFKGDWQMQ